MSDYGVTDTGFKRKPKSVVITGLEEAMKAKFGQDLDVDAESPEGQIISVIADAIDPLWEVAEHSYNAFNPNSATGVTLENVLQINNITKQQATATTVDVKFSGSTGITIPAGTSISSNPDDTGGVSYKFTTETEGITVGGIYETLAICEEVGAIQIPVGAMTIIDTPIVGIDSVTNEAIGNVGQDEETDAEVRARRQTQVSLPAVATTDAILAGIRDIETVLSAKIYENDSSIPINVDGVSISPHSIRAIVQGDTTDEEAESIAQAIYARKDPGIQVEGAQTKVIQDSQGFDKTMRWDEPTSVPFYIKIETTAVNATTISSDGREIKEAIYDYITDPVTGYTIGDDISYARLFTPVNSIPNHFVQSMTIGLTSNPTGTSDITINGSSLATVPIANIDVTVTF